MIVSKAIASLLQSVSVMRQKTVRSVLPINLDETLESLEGWLKALPNREDREDREVYRNAIDRYIRETCRKKFNIVIEDSNSESTSFFDLNNLVDVEEDREYKATHMLRAGHAVHVMAVTKNEVFVAKIRSVIPLTLFVLTMSVEPTRHWRFQKLQNFFEANLKTVYTLNPYSSYQSSLLLI